MHSSNDTQNNNSTTHIPRLTFAQVGVYLGKTDHRTIKRWCDKHNVFYDRDSKGNYYVIQQEFLYKANLKAEKAMREKYGENWRNELNLSNPFDKEKEKSTQLKKNKYKPLVQEAEKFGQKWKHL